MKNTVFVNRILNMRKIKFLGFDMDHTLIRYHTRAFEALVYEMVVQRLIASSHYPKAIESLPFHFDDAIRGLVIDSKNGNLLKLSRFGAIRQSYHGTQPIGFTEQQRIYGSSYVDLGSPDYMVIDTSFSIAHAVLFSQLVDYKDQHPSELPDYQQIALDVLHQVDRVHADGSLKVLIRQDLSRYVIKDKPLVDGLLRYKAHGKRLFLLTNSDFHYTRILLEYAINPFLPSGMTWLDMFDYVITLANKPRFFYDNLKFLRINPEDGSMTNVQDELHPGLYQGGNAKKFTEFLQLQGDEILYIGDHIYGDILRLKKDCNWRTALVVEELGHEVDAQIKALPIQRQIIEAMAQKTVLEQEYTALCTQKIDEHTDTCDKAIHDVYEKITQLDKSLSKRIQEHHQHFNPKWDRVFRAGAEESYFAYQVERFACIYMEKLSDLLSHSPLSYYRPKPRALAHDDMALPDNG